MKDIVFLGNRKEKKSYNDLHKMVRLSGFTLQDKDHVGPGDAFYIKCSHADIEPGDNRDIIFWYLERPYTDGGIENLKIKFKNFLDSGTYKELWVSDMMLAQQLGSLVKFVPIGCHPGLIEPDSSKDYDVIHLSYETLRRQNILSKIKGKLVPNTYEESKYSLIAKTKFLLNIHQSEDLYIEPLRLCLAISAGIPIISETNYNAFPYNVKNGFLEFSYESLVSGINNLISNDYETYSERALELREFIIDNYSFNENVIKALGL